MSKPGVLNLFKHETQLIDKQRDSGPPTVQLFHCDNWCTEQK